MCVLNNFRDRVRAKQIVCGVCGYLCSDAAVCYAFYLCICSRLPFHDQCQTVFVRCLDFGLIFLGDKVTRRASLAPSVKALIARKF